MVTAFSRSCRPGLLFSILLPEKLLPLVGGAVSLPSGLAWDDPVLLAGSLAGEGADERLAG